MNLRNILVNEFDAFLHPHSTFELLSAFGWKQNGPEPIKGSWALADFWVLGLEIIFDAIVMKSWKIQYCLLETICHRYETHTGLGSVTICWPQETHKRVEWVAIPSTVEAT
jgi:hypothetical protein